MSSIRSWRHSALLAAASFLVLSSLTATVRAQAPAPADAPPPESAPTATDTSAPAPAPTPPPSSPPPLTIKGPASSWRFGFLAQSQYEAAGGAAADGFSHNLFVRRARFLLGGTLFDNFELFFETDFADLFKSDAVMGVKNGPGIVLQDLMVTWKAADYLKIDAGFMLPPLSHNALQSAASLYGWDYFANAFRHSNAFRSTVNPLGRDTGVQLRGLLLEGKLEYRLGAFQGLREAAVAAAPMVEPELAARNMFRFAGRVQVNLFDPETSWFYAGTYLGAKKILSFGASFDSQEDYFSWGVDGFLDLPLGRDVITAQASLVQWDGGGFVALPKQTAIIAEAGYLLGALRLSPIVRFEQVSFDDSAANPTQTRIAGGLAWWPYGHNSNLKLFYSHIALDTSPSNSWAQINLQWQYFVY